MPCDIMIEERKKEEEKYAIEFVVKKNGEVLGTLTEEWADRLNAALDRDDIHEMVHDEEKKQGRKLTLAEIMTLLEGLLEDPLEVAHDDREFLQRRTIKR